MFINPRILLKLFGIILLCSFIGVYDAQALIAKYPTDTLKSSTTISILTCGPGAELYSSWGHSAIRITDTVAGTDNVINYGMFDFADPKFYIKYIKGTLLYYGAIEPFDRFVEQYNAEGRYVKEQVLNLNNVQTNSMLEALQNSLMEQNKYYHYDFLYENCTTKLRNMLDSVLKNEISYGTVIANDSLKYMDDLNSYLQNKPWDRLGINLLLSSEVQKKVNNYTYLYLPEALHKGLAVARNNNSLLVSNNNLICEDKQLKAKVFNMPQYLFLAISLFWILISLRKKETLAIKTIDSVFFTVLGLLGCLFLFMWLGTNHLQTKYNLNMLWCLPSHVLMSYFIFSKQKHKLYFQFCLILTLLAMVLLYWRGTAWEIYPIIIAAAFRLWIRIKN